MAGHGNRLLTYPEKFITVKELTGVAIQAAIDEVVDGGTIYLPSGVYDISSQLIVPDKRIHIFGDGNASVLRFQDNLPTSTIHMFYVAYDEFRLSRCYLAGNKTNQANDVESVGIYFTSTTKHHVIRDVAINNFKGTGNQAPYTGFGDGIHVSGTVTNMTVDNCNISACDDDGFDCGSSSLLSHSKIVNCRITGNGDNGIDTEGCDYCVFANNTIYDNVGNGIEVEEEGSGACLHNTVTGNVVYGCGNGIAVRSARYTSVVGNTVHDCGIGILVDRTASGDTSLYNAIVGNVISDCDYGIQEVVAESGNNFFASNKITNSTTADYDLNGNNSVNLYESGGNLYTPNNFFCAQTVDATKVQGRQLVANPLPNNVGVKVIRGSDDSGEISNLIEVYDNAELNLLASMSYDGRWFIASQNPSPVESAGAQLGNGSVGLLGTDAAGYITITPGSTTIVGELMVVTFSRPYSNPPSVVLFPANYAASNHSATNFCWITSTTDGFSISINDLTGWTDGELEKFHYQVIGF